MAQFAVPERPARAVVNIEYFKGVDLYNAPANVSINRSPEAPNMIRDVVGRVRKRTGYELYDMPLIPFAGTACGVHFLDLTGQQGRKIKVATFTSREGEEGDGYILWVYRKAVYAKANGDAEWTNVWNAREWQTETPGPPPQDVPEHVYALTGAMQFDGKLYIQMGQRLLVYDGDTCAEATEGAYVPTVVIGRAPSGGGTPYEAYNLLGDAWTDSFLGTAGTRIYQLTDAPLSDAAVTAQVLTASGDWVDKVEGVDFTVDRATGTVTFGTAPGESPVTGVDNVHITARKDRAESASRVMRCTVMTMYGVGGAAERLFVGGHPEYPNMDWYSGFRNPTYFPDTNYSLIGENDGAIMGYTIVGDQLATHRSGGQSGENTVLREGRIDERGEGIFPVVGTIRGEPVVSKHAFASLGREPMFLTRRGVHGLTTEDLTGERYSQLRSLYLGDALTGTGMVDACAVEWNDFYVLLANNTLYFLDGLQKGYDANEPRSSYQLECYYWPNIGARTIWVEDGALCFAGGVGDMYRFHTDIDDPRNYHDGSKAIKAYWDTPELDGQLFFKNKTFRYVAVRIAAAAVTGVEIFAQVRGLWQKIFDAGARARYFDWEYINFAKFVFSADRTPRTLGGKVKLKKVDKVRFRLQNEQLDEPFGLYSFAAEYTEPGNNYKG